MLLAVVAVFIYCAFAEIGFVPLLFAVEHILLSLHLIADRVVGKEVHVPVLPLVKLWKGEPYKSRA